MNVGFKEPGKPMVYKSIGRSIEEVQNLIGGLVEPVYYDSVVILCDEEGRLKKLPFNFYLGNTPIVGSVIVCGKDNYDLADIGVIPESLKSALLIS